MANVKSRVNAPRKTKKKGSKSNKTTQPPPVNNPVESVTVMSRPSSLKVMTPDAKVQFVLNNGHLIKDRFVKKVNKTRLSREGLVCKDGKIRKKCLNDMLLFNNVLKSELMIHNSANKVNAAKTSQSTTNNNNDAAISDNNINSLPNVNDKDLLVESNKLTSNKKRRKNKMSPEYKKKIKRKKQKDAIKRMNFDTTLPPDGHPKFICDYCGKSFYAKTSIRKHIFEHLNLPLHKCPHCPKKFRYDFRMQAHIVQDHRNIAAYKIADYKCEICNQNFLMPETYDKHLQTHINNVEKHKCMFCSKPFSEYYTLTQHEKKHLKTGRYQCTLCIGKFKDRDLLMEHLKGHLKIQEFICQYCGKEFLRQNSMQRHVLFFHSGHRIQCPICKKQLKGHLSEHMRTHDKKRPHKCPDCGKMFTQSTQLNVHRRSHTGARPYPCRICEHKFSNSNALSLHIRRHTGEKPFPCAMCPLMFSQLPHMKAHMRNIHGKLNTYKCEKCAQFFKLKIDLEKHLKNCTVGDKKLSFEEKIEASVKYVEIEVESVMSLSRMRYLLAVLLSTIAGKAKLNYLGFNKRLIDDLLIDSLEAMGLKPNKDESIAPITRLKLNIEMLLRGTVPKDQMEKLLAEKRTIEEILELLTDENQTDK